MTYVATLSHMRRVSTPIVKTGKLVQPRKLHPTQWGIVCPAETPEGASVGLVKNLALLTNITIATPSEPLRDLLADLGTAMVLPRTAGEESAAAAAPVSAADLLCFPGAQPVTRVLLNGAIIGAHVDPARLFSELKALKRRGAISVFTSVVWNTVLQDISLCTDGGRFVRPTLVVDAAGRRLVVERPEHAELLRACMAGRAEWSDVALSGAVEYMDVDEVNTSIVAMRPAALAQPGAPAYTHVDVAPSAMLGVVAGSIPFSDHNQAPRNTYQVTFSLGGAWGAPPLGGRFPCRPRAKA